MSITKLARQLANAYANFEELKRVGREGRKGRKTRERGGKKNTASRLCSLKENNVEPGKNLSNIKNSKHQLTS